MGEHEESTAVHAVHQRRKPASDDAAAWARHWTDRGQPWRRAPEIGEERQAFLRECLSRAKDQPFKGITLTRGDLEWLTETAEEEAYERAEEEVEKEHEGSLAQEAEGKGEQEPNEEAEEVEEVGWLNLQGASFDAGAVRLVGAGWSGAQLEGIHLRGAQLQGAFLQGAQLQNADLSYARLQGANLRGAQLSGARLLGAQLQDASLRMADLQGANLRNAELSGANLGRAFLDAATNLLGVTLGNGKNTFASVADVHWGDANLAVVDWTLLTMPGEERRARTPHDPEDVDKEERLEQYRTAVRANRQLATALRAQGLNEEADYFAYRAQVLQRGLYWIQHRFLRWVFSTLLAALAGYGFRLWRILVAYGIVVTLCALAYFFLGMHYKPHLALRDAFLMSITAFHGRVFSEVFQPDTPQLWVTATEAILGLIIEGTFIAVLTQRFLGR